MDEGERLGEYEACEGESRSVGAHLGGTSICVETWCSGGWQGKQVSAGEVKASVR